ncbi:hypothetical protein ACH4ZX_00890 [Streptomyces sp. NPDC020490]|uniref:hypothetical protein n=1 Tax=Streptomyces sp. NPDC020490 TaxID=3365078 RepID=UPI0037B154B0
MSRLRLRSTPVGDALLIHPRGRFDDRAAAFAGGIAEDPYHTLVVVDLPADALATEWESVARLLSSSRYGSPRLVFGRGSGDEIRTAGRLIAGRLGREVLAPDGDLVPTRTGGLFVPGDDGGAWLRFRPGHDPEPVAQRFPKPHWEFSVPTRARPVGARTVVQPVPAGVWLRRADGDPPADRHRRAVETTPTDPHLFLVVLGSPGTPPLPLDDVARFWDTVLSGARPAARFVLYGALDAVGDHAPGQALADALGHRAVLYDGPVLDEPVPPGEAAERVYVPSSAPLTVPVSAPAPAVAPAPAPAPATGAVVSGATAAAPAPGSGPADVRTQSRGGAPAHPTDPPPGRSPAVARDAMASAVPTRNAVAPAAVPTIASTVAAPEVHDPVPWRAETGSADPSPAPDARDGVPATNPSESPAVGQGGRTADLTETPAVPHDGGAADLTEAPTVRDGGGTADLPETPDQIDGDGTADPDETPTVRNRPRSARDETAGGTREQEPEPEPAGVPEPPAEAARIPVPAPSAVPETPEPEPAPPPLPKAPSAPAQRLAPAAAPRFRLESAVPEPEADGTDLPAPMPDPPAPMPDPPAPMPDPDGGPSVPSPSIAVAPSPSVPVVPSASASAGAAPEVRVQPVPRASACALPPERGIAQERDWVRRTLREQYNALAGSVSRVMSESPGLRGRSRTEAAEALTELVAVRLYLSGDTRRADAAVREAAAGPHVPLARCVTAGLRRLPSYRGPALLRTRLGEAERAWYREDRPVTEWAFCHARTSLHPGPRGSGATDVLIWSMTARRTTALDPAVPDRVLFLPGTVFRVLRSEGSTVLMREVSPSETAGNGGNGGDAEKAGDGGQRAKLDRIALKGLENILDALERAGTAAGAESADPPGLIVSSHAVRGEGAEQ